MKSVIHGFSSLDLWQQAHNKAAKGKIIELSLTKKSHHNLKLYIPAKLHSGADMTVIPLEVYRNLFPEANSLSSLVKPDRPFPCVKLCQSLIMVLFPYIHTEQASSTHSNSMPLTKLISPFWEYTSHFDVDLWLQVRYICIYTVCNNKLNPEFADIMVQPVVSLV